MEKFVVGDIIAVPFPFTDFSSERRRPALILSDIKGDDLIICEITSRPRNDNYSVILENKDTKNGNLKTRSIIRPNRLLTINQSRISYKFDELKEHKMNEVLGKIKLIFNL